MAIKRYGTMNNGSVCQEWYETGEGSARQRSKQLRKLGYRVVSDSSEQVTPVGRVRMTLLTIFAANNDGTWDIPGDGVTDMRL